MPNTDVLPNLTNSKGVLEARRVKRAWASDIVLYWSTELEAEKLVWRCKAFTHGENILSHMEIIADDDVIKADDVADLANSLKGRSLVRFNVSDWTITWRKKTKTAGAEIQAIFGNQPRAMMEMVQESISGHTPQEVDAFFDQLTQRLSSAG